MKFGVALPNSTEGLCYPVPFTSPELVVGLARSAERLGFDSVWCNDHLTTQRYVRNQWSQPPSYYDPFVSLAYVAAAERAGRWGHGWLPAALPREHIQRHVSALYRAAESARRDASSIEVAPQWILSLAGAHESAVQRFNQSFIYEHLLSLKASTLKDQDLSTLEEYNLVGTPAEVIDKIERFSRVGVTYCASLAISGNTGDDVAEQLQRFAEDVMPHFSPTRAAVSTV